MFQVRSNVFETNSSSSHSISISRKNSYRYDDTVLNHYIENWDNKVHVRFGEFGWEIESYSGPYSKLQYIITMLVETEGREIACIEDLYETDGFELINNAVANYCHCDGVCIDEEIKIERYEWNGKVQTYVEHEGYIDHRSCEDYNSVQDFLNDYGISIEDFLFNDGVVVHTDNDNH